MIMPLEKIMSKTTYVAILTFGPVHEISNNVECGTSKASDQPALFVFVALRPMSTAMVIAGGSVHLTTPFPGQA